MLGNFFLTHHLHIEPLMYAFSSYLGLLMFFAILFKILFPYCGRETKQGQESRLGDLAHCKKGLKLKVSSEINHFCSTIYSLITYLNNYFNLHVCLSIRSVPSVRSVRPFRPCVCRNTNFSFCSCITKCH